MGSGDGFEISTQTVAERLRAAVAESGLSGRRFAEHLGTSASRMSTYLTGKVTPSALIYLRALRVARAAAAARHRGWPTPDQTARAVHDAVVRHELSPDPVDWPLRTALVGRDALRAALDSSPDDDGAYATLWSTAPASTGFPEWDALLAALAAREFVDAGLAAPSWVDGRRLLDPWVPEHPWLDELEVVARTPHWLSSFGIFMPSRDLTTARAA